MGIRDVDATLLIHGAAEELKKDANIKPPEWASFVKTGMSREKPPVQQDWWFVRSAAILRKISVLGPVGTSKLKTKFGGRKNRGVRPDRFYAASGNIIRKILQQLEKAGLAKQEAKGVHKGRVITPNGTKLLETVPTQLMKDQGEKPKKKKAKKRKKTTRKKRATKAKEKPAEVPKVEEKKVEAPEVKKEVKAEAPEVKETPVETPKEEVKAEAPEVKEAPKEEPKPEGEQ
jgi:small subunit ribosomal protein S19e